MFSMSVTNRTKERTKKADEKKEKKYTTKYGTIQRDKDFTTLD